MAALSYLSNNKRHQTGLVLPAHGISSHRSNASEAHELRAHWASCPVGGSTSLQAPWSFASWRWSSREQAGRRPEPVALMQPPSLLVQTLVFVWGEPGWCWSQHHGLYSSAILSSAPSHGCSLGQVLLVSVSALQQIRTKNIPFTVKPLVFWRDCRGFMKGSTW